MKVLPMSVENAVATLSRIFPKCRKTSFQQCINFAAANILIVLGKLLFWGLLTFKCVNGVLQIKLSVLTLFTEHRTMAKCVTVTTDKFAAYLEVVNFARLRITVLC